MRTPDLDLVESDELAELRQTVRRALASRADSSPSQQWRLVAQELGLASLLVPETNGGAGASAREAAVVAQELGRCLAPVPFLSSAVLATQLLVRAGAPTEELQTLASGDRTAAVVLPATTHSSDFPVGVSAEPSAQCGAEPRAQPNAEGAGAVSLRGEVSIVVGAELAELFVVPAWLSDQPVIALVESPQRVEVTEVVSLDESRPVATVRLSDTPAVVLVEGESARQALTEALELTAAMVAAERVGIMEWAVEETTTYLGQRYQFGTLLGSYQSLRHAAARMWIDAGQARAISAHAAAAHADDPSEAPLGTAIAAAWSTPKALAVVEQALQLHGGIGFTWEHPIHRYLKRAMANAVLFGTAEQHRAELARLTELVPTAAAGW